MQSSLTTESSSQNEATAGVLRQFLQFFAPVAAIIVLGSLVLMRSAIDNAVQPLLRNEMAFVELANFSLQEGLAVPARHIRSLVEEEAVQQFYRSGGRQSRDAVLVSFETLMKRNADYRSVRWIDQFGQERLRMVKHHEVTELIAPAAMQNKRQRYFFDEIMRLDPARVYFSRFDLEFEKDRIVTPYQPVIRVAQRVFSADGQPLGFLMINVAADSLLQRFILSAGPAGSRLTLVNKSGYWLKAHDPEDEWGFLLDAADTMALRHRQAWDRISREDFGQMETGSGVWSWHRINLARAVAGPIFVSGDWKAVSLLPQEPMALLERSASLPVALSAAILLILSGLGTYTLTRSNVLRQRALHQSRVAKVAMEAAQELLRSEGARRETEAQIRLFIDYAPVALAVFDRDMCYLSASKRWIQDYGLEGRAGLVGCSHYEIFPEIDERWKAIHQRAMQGEVLACDEDRFVRADGSVSWLHWVVCPWRQDSGKVGGIIIFSEDITERRTLADSLSKAKEQITRFASEQLRLVEQERRRVAREVHDQIGQIFSAIKLIVQSVPRSAFPPGQAEALDHALELGVASARKITADLRPPLLDDLGLRPALEHLAGQLLDPEQQRMELRIAGDSALSSDAKLCLYRISQEALTNVQRYANAGRVTISGEVDGNFFRFTIEDDGKGIDLTDVRKAASGLVNMRERANLLGGQCTIEAGSGGGTRVNVSIPLRAEYEVSAG